MMESINRSKEFLGPNTFVHGCRWRIWYDNGLVDDSGELFNDLVDKEGDSGEV